MASPSESDSDSESTFDHIEEVSASKFTKEEEAFLTTVIFYHDVERYLAQCLLLQGGSPGSFLLRPSRHECAALCVSVRGVHSVQHYLYKRLLDGRMQLESHPDGEEGAMVFADLANFVAYLQAAPVFSVPTAMGAMAGVDTELHFPLRYPYPRTTETLSFYEKVIMRSGVNRSASSASSLPSAAAAAAASLELRASIYPTTTKEGYLTKQGAVHKNWKVRWFVLSKRVLSYYRNQQKEGSKQKPLKSIDLINCTDILNDTTTFPDKKLIIRLVHPKRTFFFQAATEEDYAAWFESIQFNMIFSAAPAAASAPGPAAAVPK